MQPVKEDNPVFELGTWVGRRQAFGLIANKCSAADAECLKQIRASKRYKSVAATWEQFCPSYLGLSRAHADKLIQQLEEFGSAYFELSQLVRIPEQAYRAISGAVVGHSVEYKGEKISISKENAHRIAEVVTLLRQESEQLSRRLELTRGSLKSPQGKHLQGIRKRLEGCFAQLADMGDNAAAGALIEYGLERLRQLSRAVQRQQPPAV
jgi:hypothetical protein